MSKRKNKRVVCPKPSKADINRVMEAAGLLKDSLVDEQAAEIERLKSALAGVTKERDMFERCLKSAENALAYKDKVIERIKKKNAKRMSEKCDVIAVLNKEIVFQYKRREKAEKFVNTLGQAFDLLKKNVEDYEHSIGR
jgi:hypothetical protein